MKELNELRAQIDAIDDEITKKYVERLAICGEIAEVKKADKKAVSDPSREEKVLYRVTEKVPEEYCPCRQVLLRPHDPPVRERDLERMTVR